MERHKTPSGTGRAAAAPSYKSPETLSAMEPAGVIFGMRSFLESFQCARTILVTQIQITKQTVKFSFPILPSFKGFHSVQRQVNHHQAIEQPGLGIEQ